MAIYSHPVKVISRGSGHSVTAAAAYRAGVDIYDSRTGEHHKYSNRTGVLDHEIRAPEGSPDWVYDLEKLTNAIEHREDRTTRPRDAQLAREIMLPLPHELDHQQHMELVQGYVDDRYISKGMVVHISYHAPDKGGDQRNNHAHLLATLRPINDGGEFEKKDRSWNSDKWLLANREAWADHQNRALERAGSSERVDHRSNKDRGLDTIPTHHMGKDATQMERKGEQTDIGNKNREIEYWNRELEEIAQDERIISLAIEREKRRLGYEQARKAAEARKQSGETLRAQTGDFEDESALLAERQNAMYLRQLDERRKLEADIARRKAQLERTNKEFYDLAGTQEALTKSREDLQNAQTLAGRLSGKEKEAQERVEALRLNLEDIERRQAEREGFLERNAREQLEAQKQRQEEEGKHLHDPPEPEIERDSEDMRQHRPSIQAPYSRAANDNAMSTAPFDWAAYGRSMSADDQTPSPSEPSSDSDPSQWYDKTDYSDDHSPDDEPDEDREPPRDRGPSMDR